MNEAKLYWDTSDINNPGWNLSYRNDSGNEQNHPIDAEQGATLGELAEAIEADSHWLGEGLIKVIAQNNTLRGTIRVYSDGTTTWSVPWKRA